MKLERNTGRTLLDFGVGNDFLNMTSKAQATKAKTDKQGYIKLISFIAKRTINSPG